MSLLDYLKENFGVNEPILFNEIKFKNYSKPWLKKELNKLCKIKKLKRYIKGVYYIPTNTMIGLSTISLSQLIEKKYINNKNEASGFYSGFTLMNKMGITKQVPSIIEIYTNNESSKKRIVNINNSKIILRRARTLINSQNVATLTLLQLMSDIDGKLLTHKEITNLIKDYISYYQISKNDICKYAIYYPKKSMISLLKSGVIL